MIQDRNGRCCSRANRWRGSRAAHMASRWFLWFWLTVCGTHTPDFEPCPLNANVARRWNGHICQFSSSLHWHGSLWINAFKLSSSNPEGLPKRGVSLMSKRSSLNEKTFFLPSSPRWHCPQTRRKCFWLPPLLSPFYWTQREENVGNVPISPLGTQFSSVHSSPHYLQMSNFNRPM